MSEERPAAQAPSGASGAMTRDEAVQVLDLLYGVDGWQYEPDLPDILVEHGPEFALPARRAEVESLLADVRASRDVGAVDTDDPDVIRRYKNMSEEGTA